MREQQPQSRKDRLIAAVGDGSDRISLAKLQDVLGVDRPMITRIVETRETTDGVQISSSRGIIDLQQAQLIAGWVDDYRAAQAARISPEQKK